MISAPVLASVTFCYLILLFVVAYYSEKIYKKNPAFLNNPYVYTLSLAVYCTSWTYYGSVGRFTTHGIEFLAIYIGPTLVIFTWWFLLRKMVRISEEYSITSLVDFISFRYGKSNILGIVAAIFCLLGVIPYISLQLKSMSDTIQIMLGYEVVREANIFKDESFYVALFIAIFSAVFGTRHFGDKRKHPALVGAIAFESILKLSIFLLAGFMITFVMFNGVSDIFTQMINSDNIDVQRKFYSLATIQGSSSSPSEWLAVILMSMMAVMFLPRQFHMAVVENLNEHHIPKSMYLFPLYLFLINLFVIPIAFAGIIIFQNSGNSDYYSLTIFLKEKQFFWAILVYLGGIAASTGMVIIASVSLGTVFVNNILLPFFVRVLVRRKIGSILIHLKRLMIIVIILLGYLYYYFVGSSFSLVSLGLTSFAAVTQLAPIIICGMFFRTVNAKGAIAGIIAGFVIWFYTLIIPFVVKAGLLPGSILDDGLFGIYLFNPTALFGLSGFDIWSHSLFWSLLFNIIFFFGVSIFSNQSESEKETAEACVESLKLERFIRSKAVISGLGVDDMQDILKDFFGEKYAANKIEEYLESIDKKRGELNAFEITELKSLTEKYLSEAVGPGAARLILNSYMDMIGSKEQKVFDVFKDLVSLSVTESRETLIKRLSELNLLLEVSKVFAGVGELQSKIDRALSLIKETFRFDLVILRNIRGEKLVAASYVGDMTGGLLSSYRVLEPEHSYIGRAVQLRKQIAINDIDHIELNQFSSELKRHGVLSFCHTPIIIGGKLQGILSFFSKEYKGLFTEEFLDLLQSVANQMGFLIDNSKQTEQLIKMREISKELQIAKEIQNSLLPAKFPDVRGIKVDATCISSEYVGGDYFDFFNVTEDGFDFVVADVSGHNIASALVMSEVRSLLKSIVNSRGELSPAEILGHINRGMYDDLAKLEFIITLIYMRVDTKNNRITYANAGQNPPIICDKGKEAYEITGGDPLLGVFSEYSFKEFTVELKGDETILAYTDGLTDTQNIYGDFFGIENLKKTLCGVMFKDPSELKSYILDTLIEFRGDRGQTDDVTMVVISLK